MLESLVLVAGAWSWLASSATVFFLPRRRVIVLDLHLHHEPRRREHRGIWAVVGAVQCPHVPRVWGSDTFQVAPKYTNRKKIHGNLQSTAVHVLGEKSICAFALNPFAAFYGFIRSTSGQLNLNLTERNYTRAQLTRTEPDSAATQLAPAFPHRGHGPVFIPRGYTSRAGLAMFIPRLDRPFSLGCPLRFSSR